MGTRGRIPRPEDELARPRSRKGGDQQAVVRGLRRPVEIPPADPNWHPIAIMLYEGAMASGQFDFYQQSDIAMLYMMCEEISVYKVGAIAYIDDNGEVRHKPRSGQMLQAIMTGLQGLLISEGERRRVRVELQSEPEQKPDLKVVAMDQYMDRLKAAGGSNE